MGENEGHNEWELKARNLNANLQDVLDGVSEMIVKTRALTFDGRYSVIRMFVKIKTKKNTPSAIIGLTEEAVNIRLNAPPRKFNEEYTECIREAIADALRISGDDIIVAKASKLNMRTIFISKEATSVAKIQSQLKTILTEKYRAVRDQAIQKSLETTTEMQEAEYEYETDED